MIAKTFPTDLRKEHQHMNRIARAAGAALALAGVVGAGGPALAEPASGEAVNLTFQSLAFQDTTIAATEEIVAAWNEANPDIQIELVQGSWDNVHDQLVTQFAGGTAPDIIHDAAADILGFAEQGFLADLSPHLDDDVVASVSEDIWATVTASDGSVVAAPTLLQSYVAFANVDAFEAAGVEIPTGDTLPWDDFETLATSLATDGSFGLGWGLRSPTATVMSLALGFGGDFFTVDGEDVTFEAGDAELAVPQRIHDLAFEAGALDPVSLTLSGSDVLPGFYGGDYAMYVGGSFVLQQLVEAAPEDFNWVVLPPLAGSEGADQSGDPQTMSVSADSENVEEATAFINFFMEAENLAALAQGDWLIPSSGAARDAVLDATGGENGWAEILATGEHLVAAPFQSVVDYPQWKDQIATPALQQYFADSISLEELQSQLTEGWEQVAGG
jgi:multiple sugar transport system substrate-binding protein